MNDPEVGKAVFTCGQITGMVFGLNEDTLEKWLDSKPEDDFRYEALCRETIKFKRALMAKVKT